MTVKDALKVLKHATKITLGYGANSIPCDVTDPFVLDAFGDYVVDEICGVGDDEYEIDILMCPVKEVRNG